jgi:hypothetical protein
MIKILLLRFLLLFFCCFQLAYAADVSEEYFVHRDQFVLNDNEGEQKKSFYQQLQHSNEAQSQKIRGYKSKYPEERRNILLVSVHAFYDDHYEDYETKENSRVFLSGWLPINERSRNAEDIRNVQDFFEKEPFCLGSAYKEYLYFDNATKILNIKRKEGQSSLSQSIQESPDFHPYEGAKKSPRDRGSVQFEKTFISKLIDDFGKRDINFELPGGDVYNPQNHAHSEQAFFSCVLNSLTIHEIFTREDIPKSILVNMVSYLPICNTGFCLAAIKALLSSNQFKSQFFQKIMPKLYEKHQGDWMDVIKDIRINLMFTSSDLPSSPDVNFTTQNGILFRSLN